MAVLEACGGGTSAEHSAAESSTTSTRATAEDFEAQASDFRNLHTMTKVRDFYVDNRLGHLEEAIAVAESPDGGEYPVGTIIQLVPTEAMIKRRAGFDPATNDWEFFLLKVSEEGTVIEARGTDGVVNSFGANCASCHAEADARFDFLCEDDHGCAPLQITKEIFTRLQEADPRPLV